MNKNRFWTVAGIAATLGVAGVVFAQSEDPTPDTSPQAEPKQEREVRVVQGVPLRSEQDMNAKLDKIIALLEKLLAQGNRGGGRTAPEPFLAPNTDLQRDLEKTIPKLIEPLTEYRWSQIEPGTAPQARRWTTEPGLKFDTAPFTYKWTEDGKTQLSENDRKEIRKAMESARKEIEKAMKEWRNAKGDEGTKNLSQEERRKFDSAMQEARKALESAREEIEKAMKNWGGGGLFVAPLEMKAIPRVEYKSMELPPIKMDRNSTYKALEAPSVTAFKMNNLGITKVLKSLTATQKDLHKKQGYLRWSDLTKEQQELLGSKPSGEFTITVNVNGESLTIKG